MWERPGGLLSSLQVLTVDGQHQGLWSPFLWFFMVQSDLDWTTLKTKQNTCKMRTDSPSNRELAYVADVMWFTYQLLSRTTSVWESLHIMIKLNENTSWGGSGNIGGISSQVGLGVRANMNEYHTQKYNKVNMHFFKETRVNCCCGINRDSLYLLI